MPNTLDLTVNPPLHLMNTMSFPFRDVWSISDRQKGPLTCTSISPSGVWLASGSQDGRIIFVDYKAGVLVGVLDLESRFYVTAATWRSDTVLIFGGSDGAVYHLDFEHKSKRPVSVHTLLKPLKAPVRSIAFDHFRDMLSIASGGEVRIYVRSASPGAESWDCVDHILALCAGPAGLVTALCFFGTTLSCRHLFIGHAKSGWTIWLSPRTYHRTPYTEKGNICTIGSATVPSSEQFIAIATLDNSLVTYSLREGSPVVDTRLEVSSRTQPEYRPVLPIVCTSSDLILKGTVLGDIEAFDPKARSTVSLHHARNHIIRTLNAYGDKLIVGSSDLSDDRGDSCLYCYTFSSAAEPRDWRRIDELQGPIFEIPLSSILPLSERMILQGPLGILSLIRADKPNIRWRRGAVILVGLSSLIFALSLNQPSRVGSPRDPAISMDTMRISGSPYTRPAPRNPTLSALLMWCASYLASWVSEWCVWISQTFLRTAHFGSFGVIIIVKNLFLVLNALIRMVIVVPRVVQETLVGVPDTLANFLCDILKVHGFDEICPA